MHKLMLPNLKLYQAFDSKDHYVLAKEVNSSPDARWFCTSCSCPLKLRNDVVGEDGFEHDERKAALGNTLYSVSIKPNAVTIS